MQSLSNCYQTLKENKLTICEYTPVASTFSSIVGIFIKLVILPKLDPEAIERNHYYKHLKYESFARLVTLTIPVLGNLIIGLYDLYTREQNSKYFLLKALNKKDVDSLDISWLFSKASEELRDNKEVVLLLVSKDAGALEYASERLKNDIEVGFAAANSEHQYSRYAALSYGGPKCRDNEALVRLLMAQRFESFRDASERIRGIKEIALMALKQQSYMFEYVSSELKNDPDILEAYYDSNIREYERKEIFGLILLSSYVEKRNKILREKNEETERIFSNFRENLSEIRKTDSSLFNNQNFITKLANHFIDNKGYSPTDIFEISKDKLGFESIVVRYKSLMREYHADQNSDKEVAKIIFEMIREARDNLVRTTILDEAQKP